MRRNKREREKMGARTLGRVVACWRQRKKNSGSHRPPRSYISSACNGRTRLTVVCLCVEGSCVAGVQKTRVYTHVCLFYSERERERERGCE
jgi:hypothetical protein